MATLLHGFPHNMDSRHLHWPVVPDPKRLKKKNALVNVRDLNEFLVGFV